MSKSNNSYNHTNHLVSYEILQYQVYLIFHIVIMGCVSVVFNICTKVF